jgi:hypothetical protein
VEHVDVLFHGPLDRGHALLGPRCELVANGTLVELASGHEEQEAQEHARRGNEADDEHVTPMAAGTAWGGRALGSGAHGSSGPLRPGKSLSYRSFRPWD